MSKRKNFANRDEILIKKENRCELCGSNDRLHIHHKDFDKSNNSPENAQVLCHKCHTELHTNRELQSRLEVSDRYPWEGSSDPEFIRKSMEEWYK